VVWTFVDSIESIWRNILCFLCQYRHWFVDGHAAVKWSPRHTCNKLLIYAIVLIFIHLEDPETCYTRVIRDFHCIVSTEISYWCPAWLFLVSLAGLDVDDQVAVGFFESSAIARFNKISNSLNIRIFLLSLYEDPRCWIVLSSSITA